MENPTIQLEQALSIHLILILLNQRMYCAKVSMILERSHEMLDGKTKPLALFFSVYHQAWAYT